MKSLPIISMSSGHSAVKETTLESSRFMVKIYSIDLQRLWVLASPQVVISGDGLTAKCLQLL